MCAFLPSPPSLKYSQLCSIFGFGGVSPLKPQVFYALQHPCRETGSKGATWCWTPAAAKDRPKLRALITPPRRSVGAVILGPFHQSRDKQGQKKIIQIKTGNNHLNGLISTHISSNVLRRKMIVSLHFHHKGNYRFQYM